MKFTKQQLEDWRKYEKVRLSGKFNMYFPGAQKASGLSEKRYSFCLVNYSELKIAAEEEK